MLTRINAFLSSHPVYIPFGNSQEDVRQVLFDTVVRAGGASPARARQNLYNCLSHSVLAGLRDGGHVQTGLRPRSRPHAGNYCSQVLYTVTLYSKNTRALTFENLHAAPPHGDFMQETYQGTDS